jgi:glyoxylase-like metal-dependent hydrolase (beta-lactamase superfamily II)
MTWTPRPLGPHATVLVGEQGGKYPHGNALLVRAPSATLIVDPSLSVVGATDALPSVDLVVNSHVHEDHVAGNGCFPDAAWHVPVDDLPGIRSLDGLLAIYGFDAATAAAFRPVLVEQFRFTPRADAVPFAHGAVFDLGGGVRVRAIHAPGHTRGHSFLHVEPDDVVYLGDVDLSSFGPYYGDAWSDLEDFERTLAMAHTLDARWYATFHHVGVLEGREAFVARLDRFAAVIGSREAALLAFLAAPRTMAEIVAHRFVYRPGAAVPYADAVERRSMGQHVARLAAAGRVREVEPGRWAAA